jgi:hypothetical protein
VIAGTSRRSQPRSATSPSLSGGSGSVTAGKQRTLSAMDSGAAITDTPPMRIALRVMGIAAVVLAAAPAPASAALSATDLRVGSQPAFVRVVVEFSGGTVRLNEVEATDPRPADGSARVEIRHAGIRVTARDRTAAGVRARLSLVSAGRARVQLTETAGRFKYVRVTALPAPQRLAIDLYRTAPPSGAAAEIMKGANGCLELTSVQRTGRSFRVKGIERNVFEGSFVVRVRNAAGRVVGSRVVTARGEWSQSVPYGVTVAQSGTVEAVAASAKDGSLACLVQVRVALVP